MFASIGFVQAPAFITRSQESLLFRNEVRLSKEIEARLQNLASQTGRTKTFYVREAIWKHLEDFYLAQEVLGGVQRGEEETFSLEDVRSEPGLADSN